MIKYFITFAYKYKDPMMQPITLYGSVVLDLPHSINDESDINDLVGFLSEKYLDYNVFILNIQRLPI
jgi:hypothetical protein